MPDNKSTNQHTAQQKDLLNKLQELRGKDLTDRISNKTSEEPEDLTKAKVQNAVNKIKNNIAFGKSIIWLINFSIRVAASAYAIAIIGYVVWLLFDFNRLDTFLSVSYSEFKLFISNNQAFLTAVAIIVFGRGILTTNTQNNK